MVVLRVVSLQDPTRVPTQKESPYVPGTPLRTLKMARPPVNLQKSPPTGPRLSSVDPG